MFNDPNIPVNSSKLSEKEKLKRIKFLENQLLELEAEKDSVNKALISQLEAEENAACKESLFAFHQRAWSVFEIGDFISNWHVEVICEGLEAIHRGDIENLILQVPPGCGKALENSTKIETSTGWKEHGDLVVGDILYHPSSKKIEVTHVHPKCFIDYKITFSTGESIYCNGEHIWYVNGIPSLNTGREIKTKDINPKSVYIIQNNWNRVKILSIEKLKPEDYKTGNCITVSAKDGMYLCGETHIPTHNSSLSCVSFPAWVWLHDPSIRFMTGSVNERLVLRDSDRTRKLIKSEWYQENWGSLYELNKGSNAKSKYENSHNGYRLATSVGGGIGDRFDILLIDDPHKPLEMNSQVKKDAVWTWYSETLTTRASTRGKKILIHQRLACDDLIGRVLEKEGDDWEVINLPMRYEANTQYTWTDLNFLEFKDPRNKDGELLFPQVKTEKAVRKLEKNLGSYGTAAQLQQRPVSKEGGLVKRKWFNPYTLGYKPTFFSDSQQTIGSWDLAFGKDGGSYCVGEVWTQKSNLKKYLVDEYRGRWDWIGQKDAIKKMLSDYPQIKTLLVEKKANGDGLITKLKEGISKSLLRPVNIIAVEANKSKEVRLYMCISEFESGNVFIPDPELSKNSWVEEYVEELVTFPVGKNDDRVDATTMALNWLAANSKILKGLVFSEDDYDMAINRKEGKGYHDITMSVASKENLKSQIFESPVRGRSSIFS